MFDTESYKNSLVSLLKNIDYFNETSIAINLIKNDKCISISFCNNLFARIEYKKNSIRVEIKTSLILDGVLDVLLNNINKSIDDLWSLININDSIFEIIKENSKAIYEYCYLSQQVNSFGCCSRFIQCSDNMRCINPDILLAKGCAYKKNLESGKIFYGKNRNI